MQWILAKTIVTKAKSKDWFGLDYNMNIYRGCCHGCIYCDSRSDCYGIVDFDQVCAKEHALRVISYDLAHKSMSGVIGTGSMSDPYNPFEKNLELTRGALDLVRLNGYGIGIATKSPLIIRDLDLLRQIKTFSPVLVKLTITAADDGLAEKIEPHVAVSSARFKALDTLAINGIFSGLLLMPILPFLTDSPQNIVDLLKRAKAHGASFVYPSFGVTLRDSQRAYFYKQLDRLFPGTRELYINIFGNDYICPSPSAEKLYSLFQDTCEKLGLLYRMNDIISAYQSPYQNRQLDFFD